MPHNHATPEQSHSFSTAPYAPCLLSLVGPRGAVLVDGQGRVEALVHRERPDVALDQPLPCEVSR